MADDKQLAEDRQSVDDLKKLRTFLDAAEGAQNEKDLRAKFDAAGLPYNRPVVQIFYYWKNDFKTNGLDALKNLPTYVQHSGAQYAKATDDQKKFVDDVNALYWELDGHYKGHEVQERLPQNIDLALIMLGREIQNLSVDSESAGGAINATRLAQLGALRDHLVVISGQAAFTAAETAAYDKINEQLTQLSNWANGKDSANGGGRIEKESAAEIGDVLILELAAEAQAISAQVHDDNGDTWIQSHKARLLNLWYRRHAIDKANNLISLTSSQKTALARVSTQMQQLQTWSDGGPAKPLDKDDIKPLRGLLTGDRKLLEIVNDIVDLNEAVAKAGKWTAAYKKQLKDIADHLSQLSDEVAYTGAQSGAAVLIRKMLNKLNASAGGTDPVKAAIISDDEFEAVDEVLTGKQPAPSAPSAPDFKAVGAVKTDEWFESVAEQIMQIESGGIASKVNPKPPHAAGLFQFIPKTWAERVTKYGLGYAANDCMDAETDRSKNKAWIVEGRAIRDDFKDLHDALGRDPEPEELYMAHAQGVAGATALLKAENADKKAIDVLGFKAVDNNLIDKTLDANTVTVKVFAEQLKNYFKTPRTFITKGAKPGIHPGAAPGTDAAKAEAEEAAAGEKRLAAERLKAIRADYDRRQAEIDASIPHAGLGEIFSRGVGGLFSGIKQFTRSMATSDTDPVSRGANSLVSWFADAAESFTNFGVNALGGASRGTKNVLGGILGGIATALGIKSFVGESLKGFPGGGLLTSVLALGGLFGGFVGFRHVTDSFLGDQPGNVISATLDPTHAPGAEGVPPKPKEGARLMPQDPAARQEKIVGSLHPAEVEVLNGALGLERGNKILAAQTASNGNSHVPRDGMLEVITSPRDLNRKNATAEVTQLAYDRQQDAFTVYIKNGVNAATAKLDKTAQKFAEFLTPPTDDGLALTPT